MELVYLKIHKYQKKEFSLQLLTLLPLKNINPCILMVQICPNMNRILLNLS